MSLNLGIWASSLALSFTLVTDRCKKETPPRVYTPPAIIEQTISNSIAKSDTGTVALQEGAFFRERMKTIIDRCYLPNLETLKKHKVTIALDQRLSGQRVSFFYTTAEAAFYRQGDSATLSLWDDGKKLCMDNAYYIYKSGDVISFLADRLSSGAQDTLLFAGRFSNEQSGGKRMIEWKPPKGFSRGTFKNNPQLLKPPSKNSPG